MSFGRRQALEGLLAMFSGTCASGQQGKVQGTSSRPSDTQEALLGPVNVFEFAPLAKAKLDPAAWDYLEGGTEDEVCLRDNRAAFDRLVLRPRTLVDVHAIDTSLMLLGRRLPYPVILAPAGGKNCFYPDGERVVARAAAAAKALHITNGHIEDVIKADPGLMWWEYVLASNFRDAQTMKATVKRLEDLGCQGICWTTDVTYGGRRERNVRNNFLIPWCDTGVPARDGEGNLPAAGKAARNISYPSSRFPTPTWNSVRELRSLTSLPVVLKGILTAEDAALAAEYGASGIIVSNHGGRQLDHVGGTIEALPEVVNAVSGKIPVLIDGGIR